MRSASKPPLLACFKVVPRAPRWHLGRNRRLPFHPGGILLKCAATGASKQ